MALIRGPLYRDLADLTVPGEHGSVAAASERCIALIDHHWQRAPTSSPQQTA
jgi:shikimate kinase